MNKITVNGKTYTCEGNNISVVNGEIYCDGKLVIDCNNIKEKNIKIVVNGDVENLDCGSADATINGNCCNIKTGSGDVTIKGDVSGDVSTGSGDVECGNVGGNIKTGSGDVIHGKTINTLLGKLSFLG